MDGAQRPELERQGRLLLHALDRADDIVLLLDQDGCIRYANACAVAIYGYPHEELLSRTIHDLDEDFPPSTWSQHWESLKRNGHLTVTVRHSTADGHVIPFEIKDTWCEFEGYDCSLVIARDLRHRPGSAERAQLMQFSVDHMDESVYWIDEGAKLRYANDAACRNLRYAHDELLGKSVDELDPNFPIEIWPLHWEELRERGRLVFETEHRRSDGTLFPVEVSANYLALGERAYNCAFVRNISDRKATEGLLRNMAIRDALTGLPNRTLLGDRLTQAIAYAHRSNRSLAVLFIDLDGLQGINIQHGHPTGDEVLTAAAMRLEKALRTVDTAARWGNDQFIVLVPDLEQAVHANDVALKLLDTLRMPLSVATEEIAITASIGIAVFPDDGQEAETLLKNADIAMFRAKEFGGDTIQFFSSDLNPDTAARIRMLMELRTAVDHDELCVHYQPIVALPDLAPVGVEALARWQHPERGLINPITFLGAAEETGYILDLGAKIIDCALADRQMWDDVASGTQLSVNLSVRQLRDPELIRRLEETLEAHDVAPEALLLELPQQLLASDNQALTAPVQRLAAMGVRLAIDAVGQNAAYLGLLQRLPLEVLKLDRALVGAVGSDPHALPLIEALTAAAHRLGTCVLAVGVETAEQLALMRTAGCDLAQGYAIAPPMDSMTLAEWLGARRG